MAMKMAPSQQPKARRTTERSRIVRRRKKGKVGVKGSIRMAMWALSLRAVRQRVRVRRMRSIHTSIWYHGHTTFVFIKS